MKHFILTIANRKGTGETDKASTIRFLVIAKDKSLDLDSVRNIAIEETLKTNPAGIFHPIAYTMAPTEIVGAVKNAGDLLVSTKQVDVRSLNAPKA